MSSGLRVAYILYALFVTNYQVHELFTWENLKLTTSGGHINLIQISIQIAMVLELYQ